MPYHVAFEHVQGAYKGTRFRTTYPSKAAFEKEPVNPAYTIVAQDEDEDYIKAVALDYDPNLHLEVAKRKAEERRERALERLQKTGDRKKFTEEMRNIQELERMELTAAKYAAMAQVGIL